MKKVLTKVTYTIAALVAMFIFIISSIVGGGVGLAYAKQRVGELTYLNNLSYEEPELIVTNDKHFGNRIDKPRACVVVGKDDKNRLVVCPVHTRTVNSLVLDNDYSHQVDLRGRKIADSEVYELKSISGLAPLTDNDKRKIRGIFAKK